MKRSVGTIFEVLCPTCSGAITHVRKLKRTTPGTMITCRACKATAEIERVWTEGGLWQMVALVESAAFTATQRKGS